jgi:microsomal dipeptidase-like Zn-dependent dipeptidase
MAVRGTADLHFHMANHLGFGGRLFWGTPEDSPLRDCEPAHGVGGTGLGTTLPVLSWVERTGYGDGFGHLTGGDDQFDGWPRFTSVIHQQGHVDWIRRAFDSGLRLMVALAGNNEMLAQLLGGDRPSDDRSVVRDQIAYMKQFVGRHDFMRIAYTPREAREIIGGGRLAVVLGVEVDSLGNFKKNGAPGEVTAYLEHLRQLGVRHVFPIHMANNAFGGCALYHGDLFYLLQLYLQGEPFQIEDGSSAGVEFRFGLPSFANTIAQALHLDPRHLRLPDAMGGHVNGRGLLPLGEHAIKELIRLGMLIDVDHMSDKALDQTLDIATSRGYPVVSGHTGFRELAWSKRRGETAADGKAPSETLKTAAALEQIRALGGMIAPGLHQGDIRPARQADPRVPDRGIADCAGSSTSWAQAYLYAVSKMAGRGVGFGSDCNGFAQAPGPRFGPNAAYSLHSGQLEDPVRRPLRRAQIDRQRNGVRYLELSMDWRPYRWLEGVAADEMTAEQRDMWQAMALVRCGMDVWNERPEAISERVRNLAKGLNAHSDSQLERPGIFTGDAPWEQRTGFLLATGQTPGTSDRDPARVHELFRLLTPVFQSAKAMDGSNAPLGRSVAGRRDFDINVDGMAHYGLLPDFVQDLRNIGLTEADLDPLFSSAEEYIQVWERCVGERPRLICDRIEVFGAGTGNQVVSTSWDGAWKPWSAVADGVFRPDSPVRMLSRKPGHLDLFAIGTDGRLWTAWWDGRWHSWSPVGNGIFRAGSDVAVVAREPGLLDVFAFGQDGRVYSTWWDGQWHTWFPIGGTIFPVGSPISAAAPKPDRLDIFAVGADGRLWTSRWDGRWREWSSVGTTVLRAGSPVTALSRMPGHLDLFAIGTDGRVHSTWSDSQWHTWFPIGNGVFRAGSPISAVARKPEHLDLFAIGTDNRIWATWWDGRWHDWFPIGNGVFRADSPLSVVSRAPGHLDVFSIGLDNRVYSTWWDGQWHSWFPIGDTTLRTGSPISAVCR